MRTRPAKIWVPGRPVACPDWIAGLRCRKVVWPMTSWPGFDWAAAGRPKSRDIAAGATNAPSRKRRRESELRSTFIVVPLFVMARHRGVLVERIDGPGEFLKRKGIVVRAAHAGSGDHDDVSRDRLEAGAKMLSRLDQNIAGQRRIEPGVREASDIECFQPPLAHQKPHRAGVEHRASAKIDHDP